ncbi:MAG: Gfo/Idh/MocA family oxidoreductase [Clostridia bacterium]|nr:Gfo/Idh/MocA family oxidoreductase [Clostridia bacterium]
MKKIKFGIFGLGRGSSFYDSIIANDGDLVAVCDFDENKFASAKEKFSDVTTYTDFDEFINHEGLEAVFLCNYFHEHAEYAIKALEKNIHVLSECTSNISMGDGVALVRAAEKSDAYYMIAENYPFMKFNQEMRRVYRSGVLGKVLFAEGEYNHPILNQKDIKKYCPNSKHWRYHIPRIYYITHSLGPLMYITGAVPKRVTAMPIFAPLNEENGGGSLYWRLPDRSAVVTCLNDDDSVFRVTGWSHFGGHANTYRVAGELGQIENIRGEDNKVVLSFNEEHTPEGMERVSKYDADFSPEDKEDAENAGHGGGDYFIIREFFNSIRENRKPMFDEYFATTMASVAILGHRSALEYGVPYDIPDFHKEEDRIRYENDFLSPCYDSKGNPPTIANTERAEYIPTEETMKAYDEAIAAYTEEN